MDTQHMEPGYNASPPYNAASPSLGGNESDDSNHIQPETHLQYNRVDEQILHMDHNISQASSLLHATQRDLFNYSTAFTTLTDRCSSLQHRLNNEHQLRIGCTQAYNSLYAQHQMAVHELQQTKTKCWLLQQELFVVQNYEAQKHSNADNNSGNGQEGWIWTFEARIKELEEGNEKLKEENGKLKETLANAEHSGVQGTPRKGRAAKGQKTKQVVIAEDGM
ncbi:hypothetical protein DV736_g2489, partial [Chaetothyriales sp. CBS 134916]